MDTTEIKELDVRQALKRANAGKTSVIDSIPLELYNAHDDVPVKEL